MDDNLKKTIYGELNNVLEDFDIKNHIEKRLKKYSTEKDDDFDYLKKYFKDNVSDRDQEQEEYLKTIHIFLNGEGF